MKVWIKGQSRGGKTPQTLFWQLMKRRFSSSCQLGGTTVGPTPSWLPRTQLRGVPSAAACSSLQTGGTPVPPRHSRCFSGQREGRKTAPSWEIRRKNAVLEYRRPPSPARVRELLQLRREERDFSCCSVAFETDLALRTVPDGAVQPDRL